MADEDKINNVITLKHKGQQDSSHAFNGTVTITAKTVGELIQKLRLSPVVVDKNSLHGNGKRILVNGQLIHSVLLPDGRVFDATTMEVSTLTSNVVANSFAY